MNISMRECSGQDKDRLEDHHCIHWGAADEDAQKKEDTPHKAFDGMVAKARGYVDVVICMVNQMESPKDINLVLNNMHQPSTKKIK